MMITSTGSSSYYSGQMSSNYSRSASVGVSGAKEFSEAMGNRQSPEDVFTKVDADGSGDLDQTEFQALSAKISEMTGQEVDAEEIFTAYDENEDGALDETETQAAMEAYRPEGPPLRIWEETPESSTGLDASMSPGIESYQKIASLGMAQGLNMMVLSGSDSLFGMSETLFSINTQA